MSFERNFYKASAVCPKCGLGNPAPKYVPVDSRQYWQAYDMYCKYKASLLMFSSWSGKDILEDTVKVPDYEKLSVPDRVDCLCLCGYQWSEKE